MRAIATLRVRCNGRTHQPMHAAKRHRFVGWVALKQPRYHAVDMALNAAREVVRLPICSQLESPRAAGGGKSLWYVPADGVTVLRCFSYEVVRYYVKAIVGGDLVAADEKTRRTADAVWDGMQATWEDEWDDELDGGAS